MNKKTLLILAISLIVAAIAIFAVQKQKSGTIENDFLITDTSRVEQIFMVNKSNQQVKLTKKNHIWMVDDNEAAIGENVKILLKTLMYVEIRRPVSKASTNTVIKQLATNSVKVEIYERRFLIDFWGMQLWPKLQKTKVFYVGSPTRDFKGTIMKMEDSDDIYITYLPGFNGYLTERFSPVYADWLSHSVFRLPIRSITKIRVEFGLSPQQSYEIVNNGNKSFDLISLHNNQRVHDYDTTRLLEEVVAFRNINYENYLENVPQHRIDSLQNSTPLRTITVTTFDQQTKSIRMYRRPNYGQVLDLDGELFPYDVDRMYAFIDDIEHPVTVQYFVMDKISRPLDYLVGRKSSNQNFEGFLIGQ